LAVQWLNEALFFVSSFTHAGLIFIGIRELFGIVVADSFVLRNRQLSKAAKRYASLKGNRATINCRADIERQMPTHRKIKRAALPRHMLTQNAAHLILPNRTSTLRTLRTKTRQSKIHFTNLVIFWQLV